jgi:hypothetical protein
MLDPFDLTPEQETALVNCLSLIADGKGLGSINEFATIRKIGYAQAYDTVRSEFLSVFGIDIYVDDFAHKYEQAS